MIIGEDENGERAHAKAEVIADMPAFFDQFCLEPFY